MLKVNEMVTKPQHDDQKKRTQDVVSLHDEHISV